MSLCATVFVVYTSSLSRASPVMIDPLPPRHQLRLEIEQGSLRDCLAAAVYPLRNRYAVPGGHFFTWTVGSAMFADEPYLAEEDHIRPVDIDANKPDPWGPERLGRP